MKISYLNPRIPPSLDVNQAEEQTVNSAKNIEDNHRKLFGFMEFEILEFNEFTFFESMKYIQEIWNFYQ